MNYVGNTVEGFLAAASHPGALGRTINLGSNREISVGDLAQMIIDLTDSKATIESEAARLRPEKSEVERLLADNKLAAEILGWKPAVSLEDGLAKTIEWLRGNLHRYRPDSYAI
jgi:dTDP-glucose 4,6-dehydratase